MSRPFQTLRPFFFWGAARRSTRCRSRTWLRKSQLASRTKMRRPASCNARTAEGENGISASQVQQVLEKRGVRDHLTVTRKRGATAPPHAPVGGELRARARRARGARRSSLSHRARDERRCRPSREDHLRAARRNRCAALGHPAVRNPRLDRDRGAERGQPGKLAHHGAHQESRAAVSALSFGAIAAQGSLGGSRRQPRVRADGLSRRCAAQADGSRRDYARSSSKLYICCKTPMDLSSMFASKSRHTY